MSQGLFRWSANELIPGLRPGVRYLLKLLYCVMTITFFIAVIAYGAVNSAPLLLSDSVLLKGPSVKTYVVLDYPAVTLCPVDLSAIIKEQLCQLQQGQGTLVQDCLGSVQIVQVPIKGVNYNCIQYNGAGGPIMQATNVTQYLATRTSIDTSNMKVGSPMGTYVITHAQSAPPTLGYFDTFVATPDYLQLIFLRNDTTLQADGQMTAEFRLSVSKAPLKDAVATGSTIEMIEVQLVYPEQVAFIQTEMNGVLSEVLKGRFITEAGGLAALLLFLHRILMWGTAFPLSFCCKEQSQKPLGEHNAMGTL